MTEFNDKVEKQRTRIEAEKWANGVKSLHAHSLTSLAYDTRGDDGSVLDITYNDGSIKREIQSNNQVVWLGKKLTGEKLLQAYSRGGI
jgi:hypothetical protein|tara:strand:+ start:1358 stop:1621 length:264 start_codon:yes stop_codon:yes gene_type:complete